MNVETEAVWFTTGNPFVDTGQEMMAAMAEVESPSELTPTVVKALLPRLVDLYFQEGWIKSSYSIFPNSPLHNFSLGNENKRRRRYADVLDGWLEAIEEPEGRSLNTTCAISGKPAHTYITKVYLPMSDFRGGNFQSGNETGTPVSAPVALALQFFPLGLVRVGRMMTLPHFSADYVQYKWAGQCIEHVFGEEALGTGGVRYFGTSKPANAFFGLVENLVREQRDFPDSSVTLYLFDNENRRKDPSRVLEMHYMPSRVFRFIQGVMYPTRESAWHHIVKRGYINVKEDEGDDEGWRKHNNRVYSKLLSNKSISRDFLDAKQRCPIVRGKAGWELLNIYLKEVEGMDQRRIDNLRDLGDRIAPLVRNRSGRLLALERAKSRGMLIDVLYRINKEALTRGYEQPLLTFDQIITDVFPHDVEYSDWREVKYLLLFRIYEQLFDELKDDSEYVNASVDEEGEEE